MAAYQLYSKLQTFWGNAGQLLSGGQLRFFTASTLDAQDVFGDEALSVNNGSTVDLDASGRPSVEIWANVVDSYYVELYDSDGDKQGEDRKSVPGGAGQTIPVPNSGEYLTGDGTNFAVADLTNSLLPDMTGHSNEILTTDGTTASWGARPADGAAGTSDIVIADDGTTIKFGDGAGDKFFILKGSSTLTAPNSKSGSKSVTFATPFKAGTTPTVHVQPKASSAPTTGGNVYPKWDVTSVSATGFTVIFSTLTGGTSADGSSTNSVISGDVDFDYTAIGVVAS
jgi:hypothetical protein